MRLPLRHPPPLQDPPQLRCAYLEELLEALVGVPLGAAAGLVAPPRSRGRHGNALQWHLGLSPHDGDARLDWEDRIEIKLVSIWSRSDGAIACDKLKVCDLSIDPWHKLSNVVFVFADRLTRVVVGSRALWLGGETREALARAWEVDPHFDHPDLFVEAREQAGRVAPAYYLASRWFRERGLLPRAPEAVFGFDARWWRACRAEYSGDPRPTVVDGSAGLVACPHCRGPVEFDRDELIDRGWAPARHGMPLGPGCGVRAHFVVHHARLRRGRIQAAAEFRAALDGTMAATSVFRVADRVQEPGDHGH